MSGPGVPAMKPGAGRRKIMSPCAAGQARFRGNSFPYKEKLARERPRRILRKAKYWHI